MRKLLLCICAIAVTYINGYGQFIAERFPISVTAVDYNKTNRIASITAIESSNNKTVTTFEQYDKNGLLIYKRQSGTSIRSYTYKYDKKQRLVEVVDSTNDVMFGKVTTSLLTFKYFDNGLVKERNLDGKKISFTYDKAQFKLSSENPKDDNAPYTMEFFYTADLKIATESERKDDTEQTTHYEYDDKGKLAKTITVSLFYAGYDSTVTTYQYDGKGNEINKTVSAINYIIVSTDDMNPANDLRERTTQTQHWETVYDDKNRIISHRLFDDEENKLLWEELHSFETVNGVETEKIITSSGTSNTSEELIVYNGHQGLKGESTLTDTRPGRTKVTTTKYTYTFH